jgi:glucose-6-phosphate 1-dehydrogenase
MVFRIQPDESILLHFNSKPPGMVYRVRPVKMDFRYESSFGGQLPEAYERLLLDTLRGDSTLFMREDEIEAAWEVCTDILEIWREAPEPALYRPGSWGPAEADQLLAPCQGEWRNP